MSAISSTWGGSPFAIPGTGAFQVSSFPVMGVTSTAPSQTDYYKSVAAQAATQYNVPVGLFQWQIGQESSWDPNALNAASGAQGLGQFIPSTAAARGVDVTDPVSSLYGAASYDATLYQQTGDWATALSKYGTVGSGSPASVIAGANAQLAAIGAAPIQTSAAGSTGAAAGSSGAAAAPAPAATTAKTDSSGGGIFSGFSFGRIVSVLLGLIMIAGGIYLFKPTQEFVQGVAAKAQKAAELAAA
jgi:hypothetical protein